MSQAELLALVVRVLNALRIPHMLVGSYASSYYGEPRSTHDIDLVIELDTATIPELIRQFDPERYYISESALREGRLANLIDLETGDKVDFFMLDQNPLNHVAMSRRMKRMVMEVNVDMATAEDTILSKLQWSTMAGGLPRQLADVGSIVRNQHHQLDIHYLQQQAELLGLQAELATLLEE